MLGRTQETQRITERRRRRLSREDWINLGLIGASCSIGGTLLIASINSGPKEPAATIPFRPISTPSERPEPQAGSRVELPAAIQNAVFASEPPRQISAQVEQEISTPSFRSWVTDVLRRSNTSVTVMDCTNDQSQFLSRTYLGRIGDVTSLADPLLNQRLGKPSREAERSSQPLQPDNVVNWIGEVKIEDKDIVESWTIGLKVLHSEYGARNRVERAFSQMKLEIGSGSGALPMVQELIRPRNPKNGCIRVLRFDNTK